jgi:predicted nucleotidyltransferase
MAGNNNHKGEEKPGIEDIQQQQYKKIDIKNIEKDAEESKKELEKTKEHLEKFKKEILKKYNYISAIGLLPPQANQIIEEEEFEDKQLEEIEKSKEKLIHLLILVPDEKVKEIPKIKVDAISIVKDFKPKVWVHVKCISELWEIFMDGKYAYGEAIAMSYPLIDKGILGALRVASIHKTLVLKKFEKYIVSYVIAGSLIRGTTTKTSDVDVYIIINDTDVKRMSRLELKEKLRGIIYSYVIEAGQLAGVENKLSPQVYILTEFWESVKDAHPVIFTFIRDGIPLFDQGAFTPWKLLLKMGKIKPSPEAIDMFMSLGDKVIDVIKGKMLDLVLGDLYWGILTPSQAVLMLYGLSPPTPKETVALLEEVFVKKEKMLEMKYVHVLKRVVEIYKGYEHGKVKSITGKEVDEMLKDFTDYIKRLKELAKQIEERTGEKTIFQIYKDVFDLLEKIFGRHSELEIVKKFEKELVKTGKIPDRSMKILQKLIHVKKDIKKKKMNKHEVESARKDASELISQLIEYVQRKDFVNLEKNKLTIKYKDGNKDKVIDGFLTPNALYVIIGEDIKKIDAKGIISIKRNEFQKAIEENIGKPACMDIKIINGLKNLLGKFEISLG